MRMWTLWTEWQKFFDRAAMKMYYFSLLYPIEYSETPLAPSLLFGSVFFTRLPHLICLRSANPHWFLNYLFVVRCRALSMRASSLQNVHTLSGMTIKSLINVNGQLIMCAWLRSSLTSHAFFMFFIPQFDNNLPFPEANLCEGVRVTALHRIQYSVWCVMCQGNISLTAPEVN